MKLMCDDKEIRLRLDCSEKNSMMVAGGSRMGKSILLEYGAEELILHGDIVYVVDLGDKWTVKAKERLVQAGADWCFVGREGINFEFSSISEMTGCAKVMANAMGFMSIYAQFAFKNALQRASKDWREDGFTMAAVLDLLSSDREDEWARKVYERLSCMDEALLNVSFKISTGGIALNRSRIWDFSGIDDECAQLMVELLGYVILCKQKMLFRTLKDIKSVYLMVDEFQNLRCNRYSIVGKCLTEGQKYRMYLILATQFLDTNFSQTVLNQFKQGGYRFYFRLTEEEAAHVSRQIVYGHEQQKKMYKKLMSLPVGHCLMIGAHSVGNRREVVEIPRFLSVKIRENKELEKCVFIPKCVKQDSFSKSGEQPHRKIVPKKICVRRVIKGEGSSNLAKT